MSTSTSTDPIDESPTWTHPRAFTLAKDASTLDRTLDEPHAIPTGYRTVRLSGLAHR